MSQRRRLVPPVASTHPHPLPRCARTRLPQQQALRVLSGLAPAQLLQTLGVAYIGNGAANYGCRALAVQLLLEAMAVLAAAQEAGALEVSDGGQT